MTSSPVAALVVALTMSAVLLVSGVAKARDRRATEDAFIALRVPSVVPAGPGAAALPWVEVALAVLLLVSPAAIAWVPAAAVLLLMLAYTGLVARALGRDEPVRCACFGSLGRHEVGAGTLGRNVLLSALAGVLLLYAVDGGSVPSAVADLTGAGWWTLLATVAAVAVAVLVVGPAPSAPSPVGSSSSGDSVGEAELLDYERRPIPYGVVSHLDGTSTTMRELATTRARLLVFLSSYCGACERVAEDLDGWADRLSPAVGVHAVYATESEAREPAFRTAVAGWEPDLNLYRVLALAGTPSAVLLGADGLLAGGPVSGEGRVVELVEAVLEELGGESPEVGPEVGPEVEPAGEPVEQE